MIASLSRFLARTAFATAVAVAAAALWFAPRAAAQTIPSGGTPMLSVTDFVASASFRAGSTGGLPIASRTNVVVTGQTFTTAARIDVLRPTSQFWDSALYAASNRAVAVNDVVLIHFFMRAITTTDETGSAYCQVFAEGPAPSYTKSLSQQVSAGLEWIEYFIPFQVSEATASGQFVLNFGLAAPARPQVLEIANVEMIWYGTSRTMAEMPRTSFRYEGRELDAPWRAAAATRIEQYRKGDYAVRVVNQSGQSVPNASVHVKLKRHAFPFMCSWDAARIVNQTTADNRTYRTKLLELFNGGSTGNDLKWQPWIGEWGSGYSRTQTMAALDWMKANSGFELRGHVLVWPGLTNLPAYLKTSIESGAASVPQTVLDHIQDIVTATKDHLPEWDVLNEPYDNHILMDKYGNSVMVDWFKEARKHHPTARLYINDYAIISGGGLNVAKQNAYAATIKYLLDNGAPLDGVGFQGHFDGGPTGMTKAWSVIERYANEFPSVSFKITEFDVDTTDEQLQADYTRDFLTLCFSHPRFSGFQVWGYWESAHWRPRAAMYRANWEEKPNGAAWRALVNGAWKTDETKLTAADGRATGRGFFGDYDIEVSVAGKTATGTFNLSAASGTATVTVNLPSGAPAIVSAPQAFHVPAGSTATLSVSASGTLPMTYVWRRNGAVVSGATSATLTLTNAQTTDAADYTVTITNGDGSVTTSAVPVVVGASSGRVPAISMRARVGTGSEILVPGLVVGGSAPQNFLVRALGPKLADFGIPAGTYLADPVLKITLLDGTVLSQNDDWGTNANAAAIVTATSTLGAQPLNAGSKDAVLLTSLAPGIYTPQISGAGSTTGVALVEFYNVDTGNRVPAISMRARVGTGSEILVPGLVVEGTSPKMFLIRALGPKLADFGIPSSTYLADPQLKITTLDGTIVAQNDNWSDNTNVALIPTLTTNLGAQPLTAGSKDAVLLVALAPGIYTPQISGVGGTSGVSLVEFYNVE